MTKVDNPFITFRKDELERFLLGINASKFYMIDDIGVHKYREGTKKFDLELKAVSADESLKYIGDLFSSFKSFFKA